MAAVRGYYATIKNLFPPCPLAFAYGSAALPQHGVPMGKMLDLIFVVSEPLSWHKTNIKVNKHHYSSLRCFGARRVAAVQDLAASVYFNPLVTVNGQLLKYGVISEYRLLEDLEKWTSLYISGRLHKPVVILQNDVSDRFTKALEGNLKYALHTALLLSPEKITLEDFFMILSGCSYEGDFRMIVGEDKNKVRNIVLPHVDKFFQLYQTHLKDLSQYVVLSGNFLHQEVSPSSVCHHLNHLPDGLRHQIPKSIMSNDALLCQNTLKKSVRLGLRRIVKWSSLAQSVKGIFTAGPGRSLVYSSQKIKKMIQGYFQV